MVMGIIEKERVVNKLSVGSLEPDSDHDIGIQRLHGNGLAGRPDQVYRGRGEQESRSSRHIRREIRLAGQHSDTLRSRGISEKRENPLGEQIGVVIAKDIPIVGVRTVEEELLIFERTGVVGVNCIPPENTSLWLCAGGQKPIVRRSNSGEPRVPNPLTPCGLVGFAS
jgi:hypothetical protein